MNHDGFSAADLMWPFIIVYKKYFSTPVIISVVCPWFIYGDVNEVFNAIMHELCKRLIETYIGLAKLKFLKTVISM